MNDFHKIRITIEEFSTVDFNNEAMRALTQDVLDFASMRAVSLGLNIVPPLGLYYRSTSAESIDEEDTDHLLDVFEGRISR